MVAMAPLQPVYYGRSPWSLPVGQAGILQDLVHDDLVFATIIAQGTYFHTSFSLLNNNTHDTNNNRNNPPPSYPE